MPYPEQEGFDYLSKNGVNEPGRSVIAEIVKNLSIGEEDALKYFLKPDTKENRIKKANSKHKRAIIFKRSVIKRDVRSSLIKVCICF